MLGKLKLMSRRYSYVIYWKGPVLRKRSPFAQQLNNAKKAGGGHVPEK